jgi:ABC-2 type transport system ATP-binding protein
MPTTRPDGSPADQVINAVDGVSLDFMAGQILSLLGQTSCRKITTMRCGSTLSRPDKGFVEVYGIDIDGGPLFGA